MSNLENTETDEKSKSILARLFICLIGLGFAGALVVVIGFAIIYPKLPSLENLTDYRPKVPLRIMSSDGVLLGEFGEERRRPVHISQVPLSMQQAVLAAEDSNFYNHFGVDFKGIARALVANITSGGRRQGASTITMQVARNFFLKRDRTLNRKLYEMLLAFKIEANLTKDEILELYLNQIYLGQRAYGFASAARIYYGKRLQQISIAEAAMLAGLPKAPSAFNPIVNPPRARIRQEYVLRRMLSLNYITHEQYDQAKAEKLIYKTRRQANLYEVDADYAAEMARRIAINLYGQEVYTAGLTVTTTLISNEQNAARKALRKGVMNYELRQFFRGPEGFIELPNNRNQAEEVIADEISEFPDYDELKAAVVLQASPGRVIVSRGTGESLTLTGKSLNPALSWLDPRAPSNKSLRRGAVVRILLREGSDPILTQLPEVEAALVAINSDTGAIRALVGGFEFRRNKFNHVTQSIRQPGSSFKPFVYSAALEKGVTPTTLIADEPLIVPSPNEEDEDWAPKNYDGKFDGPLLLKEGLARSKNLVSIRVLQYITPEYAQKWVTRFGFNSKDVPPYLTMALGAVTTNPLQMANAYSVFANGGYRVRPYLIEKITDSSGRVLAQARPAVAGNENNRAIDERNAFMMQRLLREIVERGTARKARTLKRKDIGGKTGTTNDSHDAWFAGIGPEISAVAWVGYGQPRPLGDRETGGGLALPIWIDYMREALDGVPEKPQRVPPGITYINDNYYFSEYTPGTGVERIDVEEEIPQDEIPSLFNFLKGLGNVLVPGPSTPPSAPAPIERRGTPPPTPPSGFQRDEIERLFGN